MTREEATIYLAELEAKRSKSHYLARFPSSKPLVVSDPTAFDKKEEALVALGRSKYQKPYEAVRRVYPGFPLCKWYQRRVELGIVPQKQNIALMKKPELKDERGVMICNAKKCKTCIFHIDQKTITPQRLGEIQVYLIQGTPHTCHSTPYLCRGGREYQAQIFYRLGWIDQPTVEAIEERIVKQIEENE